VSVPAAAARQRIPHPRAPERDHRSGSAPLRGASPDPAGRAVTPGIRGSPDEAALLPDDDAITGTILGTGTERRSSSDTPEYFSALGVRSRAEDEGTQWPIVELWSDPLDDEHGFDSPTGIGRETSWLELHFGGPASADSSRSRDRQPWNSWSCIDQRCLSPGAAAAEPGGCRLPALTLLASTG
jgi:hypothetical protein